MAKKISTKLELFIKVSRVAIITVLTAIKELYLEQMKRKEITEKK